MIEYDIPFLFQFVNNMAYYPYLGSAITRLIDAVNKIKYIKDEKELAEAKISYEEALKDTADAVFKHQTTTEVSKTFQTPLFHPLKLKSTGKLKSEFLFEACETSIKRTKIIKSTSLQGMDGTIKEYVANGDWMIDCQAILIGEGFEYPTDQVNKVNKIFNINEALEVIHPLLNDFDITKVVVTNFEYGDIKCNFQVVKFSLLSDNEINL